MIESNDMGYYGNVECGLIWFIVKEPTFLSRYDPFLASHFSTHFISVQAPKSPINLLSQISAKCWIIKTSILFLGLNLLALLQKLKVSIDL